MYGPLVGSTNRFLFVGLWFTGFFFPRNASKNINNKEFSRLVSMSKIKSDLELGKISWISHQLHGAIGFTWDYGLHLYTKKILINKSLGGDLSFHSTRLYPDGN